MNIQDETIFKDAISKKIYIHMKLWLNFKTLNLSLFWFDDVSDFQNIVKSCTKDIVYWAAASFSSYLHVKKEDFNSDAFGFFCSSQFISIP